jgi:hypothetical protein
MKGKQKQTENVLLGLFGKEKVPRLIVFPLKNNKVNITVTPNV